MAATLVSECCSGIFVSMRSIYVEEPTRITIGSKTYKCLFMDVFDKHAPLMERRVKNIKHIKQAAWFTGDIKEAIYLKDKYFEANNVNNMTFWRNKFLKHFEFLHLAQSCFAKSFLM